MIKSDELHRNFLRILEEKIPEKTKIAEKLMEMLFLEKGAVMRRLRGEVPFSVFEVVRIAEILDISLNSLLIADAVPVDRFVLNIIEYTDMSEMDYKQWEDYNVLIATTKNDPFSEMIESSNVLPLSIYSGFEWLTKYYLFKYQYLFCGTESRTSFGDLALPKRLSRIYQSYFQVTKNFAETIYIWDNLIFQYLLTDIRFFFGINLISDDDIRYIKSDLFALLDYLEDIAINGCFYETGKPVLFYISDINLEADYSCLRINDMRISHLRTFILNSVVSTDQSSYKKLSDWIHSLKRSSTLITQSGAVYRADFFEKQRSLISEL